MKITCEENRSSFPYCRQNTVMIIALGQADMSTGMPSIIGSGAISRSTAHTATGTAISRTNTAA